MKYAKYYPWLILIVVVILMTIWSAKKQHDLQELITVKNEELMKGNLELGRANTKFADASKMLSQLSGQIQKEIKDREAVVNLYAVLEAKYQAEKKKVKTVTTVVYKDRTVDHQIDLPKNKLFVRTDDGQYKEITSLLYSYNDFRITIQGDAIDETISYKLHQKFRVKFVETTLPTGARNHYAEIYELDDKGKDVGKLSLEKFDVIRSNELPNRWMWFNPKLDLQFGAGSNQYLGFSWAADLGVSFSSYGKTPDDIFIRLFRVGAGLTRNGFELSFSPVSYNLGKDLPLISNLWLTAFAGYDFGVMGVHFGAGISVVL